MKNRYFSLLLSLAMLSPGAAMAQSFVNLTPKARTMTVANGKDVTLPAAFSVAYTGLTAEEVKELDNFAATLKATAGIDVTISATDASALISVTKSSSMEPGNYKLNVNNTAATKVTIEAGDVLGVYYALQTVKKILPPNVMAGKADAKVTSYVLPGCTIDDGPRFSYRGFMLDVSRHFYTVEEVKRMLDVMAYYKMNRFHWHLSDDQGWRIEIKKYPKLTTIGATAANSYMTDLNYGAYYTNKQYGPYAYTQEQIKDVVAYAKERHIEIIPEIDMPGHFVAALAAYPEYSCNPSNPPTVWVNGGISTNVLNVGNPAAIQFAKDIVEEVMALFPYDYMHIGGDECPTSAWAGNAECQALKQELGYTNDRQLQSYFIKQMGDFIKSKGKKLILWNESITADGADIDLVKGTDATIFCWQPAVAGARKAAELGLNNVFTPWGPYYINRQQNYLPQMLTLPGDGTDDVKSTYSQEAVPTDLVGTNMEQYYTGVQGTFWTEHIGDADMMEYMALPRLIAIAEAGWTPKSLKDFADFQKRIAADSVLLNYGNYAYCNDYMIGNTPAGKGETAEKKVMPTSSTADAPKYYQITSRATDATRSGRAWELLVEDSPLITTYAGKGAAAGVLWSNTLDANNDAQYWTMEADPAGSGRFAIVNKTNPAGSLKPSPSNNSTGGRWSYDAAAKHYDFDLGTAAYGQADTTYYYSVASQALDGFFLNCSMSGQGFAVNVWKDANDSNAGIWTFTGVGFNDVPSDTPAPVTFSYLEEGKQYRFANAIDGYNATAIVDNNQGTILSNSDELYTNNAWTVEAPQTNADGSQTMKLKNAVTGRYFGAPSAYVSNVGFPITASATAAEVTISYNPATSDYNLIVGAKKLLPVSATAPTNAGIVASGSSVSQTADAVRPAGAAWLVAEVVPVTMTCVDEAGNDLGTYVLNVEAGKDYTVEAPALKNLAPVAYQLNGATSETAPSIAAIGEAKSVTITYKRSAYAVTYKAVDTKGGIIDLQEANVPVGQTYTVTAADEAYYTLQACTPENGTTFALTSDTTITAVYTTEAFSGVKRAGELVTKPVAGQSYLIYDASPANNGGRKGYRNLTSANKVNRTTTAEGARPGATWTLEKSTGSYFKVLNDYANLYVPTFGTNENPTVGKTGGNFTFTLNDDGRTFKIQGSNSICWDGQENGNLVGWSAPGHPYELYTYFVQPFFEVDVKCVDMEGNTLKTSSELVMAGNPYNLVAPTIDGYSLNSITGNEGLDAVGKHYEITLTYADPSAIGHVEADQPATQRGIFDLQGRKLQHINGAGIYVVNGQKIVVK